MDDVEFHKKIEQEIGVGVYAFDYYEIINNCTLGGVRLVLALAFYPLYQTEDLLTPEGDAEVDAYYDAFILRIKNGTDHFRPSTEEEEEEEEREREKFGTNGFFNALKLVSLAYKAEANSNEARRLLHLAVCQISIGFGYLDGWHRHASYKGAIAAKGAHREHHALRDNIVQYYLENKDKYKSKDAAAEDIAKKIVPLGFRAVRRHLNNL